ncbi:unnamed protein product [Nezara viridula]|uniref:Ornithine aminotransferase n=1 Tax=Nezara viridula TaxID=85310 RepID=A0A9P0HUQ6_NEZVI|nr:unnamed protein product [Nezara viridula]
MKIFLNCAPAINFTKYIINIGKRFQHHVNAYMLEVDLCKGQGTRVWDKNGKEYLDFYGQNGSVNAGHCHCKLIQAMQDQMCQLHQATRSLHNNVTPEFCSTICQMFNYDRVMVHNTGCEAVELAVKLARLWGYKIKKICPKEAIVVFTNWNYWGNSICAISASVDPILFNGFQPLLSGLKLIPYDDPCSLEEILKNPNVCGFVCEPIQSEYGVMVPLDGYLAEVRRLCTQSRVLWIADEIQCGLGRTGYMLGSDYECVKPDILCLGKSLAGGMYPLSACLASCEVMDLLSPGAHYTTFGANPLGCRVGTCMLKVTKEDLLPENAAQMGALFRDGLLCSLNKDDMPLLRGRGLLWACQIDPRIGCPSEITDYLRGCGLLVYPCRDKFIRFTPPLNISEEEIAEAVSIFKNVIDYMKGCGLSTC